MPSAGNSCASPSGCGSTADVYIEITEHVEGSDVRGNLFSVAFSSPTFPLFTASLLSAIILWSYCLVPDTGHDAVKKVVDGCSAVSASTSLHDI